MCIRDSVWEKASTPSTSDPVDLRTCDCNWSSAEDHPELLDDLISMEVKNGFLVEAWLSVFVAPTTKVMYVYNFISMQ